MEAILNKETPEARPTALERGNNAAFYEQLALTKLKQLGYAGHEWPKLPPLKELLLGLARLVAGLFTPGELVLKVAPGKRPLRRHEWDQTHREPRRLF